MWQRLPLCCFMRCFGKEMDRQWIIYLDNHQLVVCKPAGILTQPSGTDQANLLDLAKSWLKKEFRKPGNVFLEAVHRIDKPVSGIVLFARSSKGLSRLAEAVREKRSKKIYVAWLEGMPAEKEALLEHYLVHGDHKAIISGEVRDPEAKLARLSYRVVEERDGKSKVEIELETGRYHQIRAQFAAIGCPVMGDLKYGSKSVVKGGEAILLHHSRLSVPHPVTGEMQDFRCAEPEYFLGSSSVNL